MAVTGIILFGFVVVHMLGNLQIFLGPEALNGYAEHLESLPILLWPARFILLVSLILHVTCAISLTRANHAARPIGYEVNSTVRASYASRTMMMSGLIVFAFIVYHLMHFTFKVAHPEISRAAGSENVYGMVVGSFRVPGIAASYIFAMFVLCAHLSHGVSSLFQSLGLNNRKWDRRFKFFARLVAFVIFAGNTSIPLAALLGVLK